MKFVAWIWSVLMIGGVLCALAMEVALPQGLAGAMIAAGVATLPTLWAEPNGLLAGTQLPGKARASFALIALIVGGLGATPYGVQRWYAMDVVAA